jgi:hypothetical protein
VRLLVCIGRYPIRISGHGSHIAESFRRFPQSLQPYILAVRVQSQLRLTSLMRSFHPPLWNTGSWYTVVVLTHTYRPLNDHLHYISPIKRFYEKYVLHYYFVQNVSPFILSDYKEGKMRSNRYLSCFAFGRSWVQISARRPAMLTVVFRCLLQVIQILGDFFKSGHYHFHPHPFQSIIHLSSFH